MYSFCTFGRVTISLLGLLALPSIGCLGVDHSVLIGTWEGRPVASESALDDEQQHTASSVSQLDFTTVLTFKPKYRFTMRLINSDGTPRETSGTWRVDKAAGTRWEIALREDDTQRVVKMAVAFDDDGFSARQIYGDDRIESVYYRRKNS